MDDFWNCMIGSCCGGLLGFRVLSHVIKLFGLCFFYCLQNCSSTCFIDIKIYNAEKENPFNSLKLKSTGLVAFYYSL